MKNHIGKYNSEKELNFALSKEELFVPYAAIVWDEFGEMWDLFLSRHFQYENVWLAGGRDNDTIYVKDKEGNISKFTLIGNDETGPCIPKDSIENFVAAGSFGNTDCTLTSISYINNVELGKVKDFTDFWYNLSSLTEFPLIDTSKGTNFQSAWQLCDDLTSFPLINTANGTNFRSAWMGCSSLTSFPQLDTSKGTNFYQSWFNCSSLTEFPALDLHNGTDFYNTWRGCTALTTMPQLDLSNGTNFAGAWYGCSNLTNLGGFGAIKESIDLTGSPKLTYESIMNVINQAADLNELGITGKSMSFGSDNWDKFTDEQNTAAISVANSKGWGLH